MSLAAFFNTADFAVPATVRGRTINVIFDEQYIDAGGVESSEPVVMCQTAEIADVEQDDTLSIQGRNFRVIGVQPDGTGVTVLRLQKI